MSRLDLLAPLRWLAVSLTFALAAHPVWAADPAPAKTTAKPAAKPAAKAAEPKPREGSLGKASASAPLLTRDELRQCLAEQDRIKQETADVLQTQRAIEKDRIEIERLGAELEAEKATLDRTSEAAVNAYNDRARQRAKLIDEFKAQAAPFNDRVDKLGADKQAHAPKCADRRYFEDDYDAIKAGR